jgi:hypothetical protein
VKEGDAGLCAMQEAANKPEAKEKA